MSRGTVLPIKLYNNISINCEDNNLLSVLKTCDDQFEQIVMVLDMRYYVLLKPDGWNAYPEWKQKRYYRMGWNLLGVDIKPLNVAPYFERVEEIVSADADVIGTIQRLVDDGWYVFIKVDRYYFPDGFDSGKNHFVHPTFIYGYDDERGKLLMVEDCIDILQYREYELAYTDLIKAIEPIVGNSINAYKLNDSKNIRFTYHVRDIIGNCKAILNEELDYSDLERFGHIVKRGLYSIDDARNGIEAELPKVNPAIWNDNLALYYIVKTPKLLQERNLLRIRLLLERKWISRSEADDFVSIFNKMNKIVDLYCNSIMKYFYKKHLNDNYNFSADQYNDLRKWLAAIKENEDSTAHKLIGILERVL
jgi:hypothetical protein